MRIKNARKGLVMSLSRTELEVLSRAVISSQEGSSKVWLDRLSGTQYKSFVRICDELDLFVYGQEKANEQR